MDIATLGIEIKTAGIQTAEEELDRLAKTSENAERATERMANALSHLNGSGQEGLLGLSTGLQEATRHFVSVETGLINVETAASGLSRTVLQVTRDIRTTGEAAQEAGILADGAARDFDRLAQSAMDIKTALPPNMNSQITASVNQGVSQSTAGVNELMGATHELGAVTVNVTDEMSESWNNLAQNIQSSLTNVFMDLIDGTADFGQTIVNMFKNIAAQIAAAFVTQKIAMPLMSMFGLSGTGSGSGGISLGGFNVSNMFSGGFWDNPVTPPSYNTTQGAMGSPTMQEGWLGNLSWGDLISGGMAIASFAIPALMKLFEDRPQPEFDTVGTVPTSFQSFISADPSDLLSVTDMNEDAIESLGEDAQAVQDMYNTVVGGFRNTFAGIYRILPDAIKDAWDAAEMAGFENIMESTRATTALAVTGHLKEWISGMDYTMTHELVRATARAFGESRGLDQSQIQRMATIWVNKLNDWFAPALMAATDETLGPLMEEYGEYLTNFFTGIGTILAYAEADPVADVEEMMGVGQFEAMEIAIGNLDDEIRDLIAGLNDLEGPEYAAAVAQIGAELESRYQMELEYIAALKTAIAGLINVLEEQKLGFEWELMTPDEQYTYAGNEAGSAYTDAYTALVMGDIDGFNTAISDFIFWQNKQWDLGGQLWGTEWQEANLAAFTNNIDTLIQWANSMEGIGINNFMPGHEEIGDDVTDAIGGIDEGVGWRRDYIGEHEEIDAATRSVEDLGTATTETTTHMSALNTELPPLIDNTAAAATNLELLAGVAAGAINSIQAAVNNLNWQTEVNA